MQSLIVIALLALQLFGLGWSSEHKAYWEWKLGHRLEGWEEHRLSRGWAPDGNGPLLLIRDTDPQLSAEEARLGMVELDCYASIGSPLVCEGR